MKCIKLFAESVTKSILKSVNRVILQIINKTIFYNKINFKGKNNMDEIIVIKIVFGSMLSIGTLVLLVIAFKLYYKYLVQEKRCLKKTKGIVKKYTLASRG